MHFKIINGIMCRVLSAAFFPIVCMSVVYLCLLYEHAEIGCCDCIYRQRVDATESDDNGKIWRMGYFVCFCTLEANGCVFVYV